MHFQHPDGPPPSGIIGLAKVAAATVAMTAAAVCGCLILAAVAILTTNPAVLLIAAIFALVAAGCVAAVLARIVR